jgi:hypothetical protein
MAVESCMSVGRLKPRSGEECGSLRSGDNGKLDQQPFYPESGSWSFGFVEPLHIGRPPSSPFSTVLFAISPGSPPFKNPRAPTFDMFLTK